MIHSVVATNRLGYTYTFDMQNRIVTGFDVSGLGADVNYTETNFSGSRYQNTVLRNRELALEVQIRKQFQTEELMDVQRDKMYRVFTPESNPIRFDFKLTNGEEYYLTAYSLTTPIMRPNKSDNHEAFQRALLQFTCTDPYIYQNVESRLDLATYEGGFEFDWEIPEDGDEFETRGVSLNGTIFYPGTGIDGMVIKFIASGTIVNPIITNIFTSDFIKLNTTLISGDVVTVTTYKGDRKIILNRGGNESNIFNTISLPGSSFLQLNPGDNTFTYGADSGSELLDIVIEYRIRKVGV